MKILILSVSKETVPTAKGSYDKLEVAYKGEDGQVKGKKIMSFGDGATAFKALKGSAAGESYDVTSEKIGEYWTWTAVSKSDGSVTTEAPTAARPATSGGKVTGSTYETPEERAKKQVYIVRQSSVTAALSFLGGKAKSLSEVIQLAKEIESYVFSTGQVAASHDIADMQNDIPL